MQVGPQVRQTRDLATPAASPKEPSLSVLSIGYVLAKLAKGHEGLVTDNKEWASLTLASGTPFHA